MENQLAPTLSPGEVVILDNLSSHKSEKTKAIFKQVGVWLLFFSFNTVYVIVSDRK